MFIFFHDNKHTLIPLHRGTQLYNFQKNYIFDYLISGAFISIAMFFFKKTYFFVLVLPASHQKQKIDNSFSQQYCLKGNTFSKISKNGSRQGSDLSHQAGNVPVCALVGWCGGTLL